MEDESFYTLYSQKYHKYFFMEESEDFGLTDFLLNAERYFSVRDADLAKMFLEMKGTEAKFKIVKVTLHPEAI